MTHLKKMRYRLALDLGSTSLGWAMVRLDAENAPCAVIKAGVRIFSDGRNPKDGSSLAVTRREARAMRRRRDRLLKRKARMMNALIAHGFFPGDEAERKQLERLEPLALRAKGLDQALTPAEFGRALFHINQRMRSQIADLLAVTPDRVKTTDLHKMILWEELNRDNAADRRCPYSGVQISVAMLFSDEVEIEHILPFSQTLDDSLNNKTVAMRQANRIKGNRTPWQAREDFAARGWAVDDMLGRAEHMPRSKRYRFGEHGYEQWLRDDQGFLARALNDTRYLSRVAREFLGLVCPQNTRVIPGQMTALLRGKFGLNDILGRDGEKNRNDHRHHAVDACVIAVTDQGLLQRFAKASGSAREQQLGRLVDSMPEPWPGYRDHVQRAIDAIWVSHKPDHGHEGSMHNDTAYGLLGNGRVRVRKVVDGQRVREESTLKVIPFASDKAGDRHGWLPNGEPRPYKGYKGDSNYCIEIVRDDKGKWEGEVISTFEAYQLVRQGGVERLRHPTLSCSGRPLVMRLMRHDSVRLVHNGQGLTLRLCKMSGDGVLAFASVIEANVDARTRAKDLAYVYKTAGSLQGSRGRLVTISSIGELRDPGFKGHSARK